MISDPTDVPSEVAPASISSKAKSSCFIPPAALIWHLFLIKELNLALQLINAGATSLGTSVGVELTKKFKTYSRDK